MSEHDITPYKQYILEMCAARDDDWANEVRLCVLGAVADLHAAEARYHKDSMRRFFSNRMNPTGQENNPHISTSECQPDMALKHKIAMLSSDRKRIWNSVSKSTKPMVDLTLHGHT